MLNIVSKVNCVTLVCYIKQKEKESLPALQRIKQFQQGKNKNK